MSATQSDRDDFAVRFTEFLDRFLFTAEVSSYLMDEAADLAREAYDLVGDNTVGQDRLGNAIAYWDMLGVHDLDAARGLVLALTINFSNTRQPVPMSNDAAAGWLEQMRNSATPSEVRALDVAIRVLRETSS